MGRELPKAIITDTMIAVEHRRIKGTYTMYQVGHGSDILWSGFAYKNFDGIEMGLENIEIQDALRFYRALEGAELDENNQGRRDMIQDARNTAATNARRLLEEKVQSGATDGVKEERAFRRLGILPE